MKIREFLLMIAAVVKRLLLHRSERHRQMFVQLSPLLVSLQDRGPIQQGWNAILTGYRSLMYDYSRSLARDFEAGSGSVGRMLRLPLGCRFGKLHLSPIMQLAKLIKAPEVQRVNFAELPRTRQEIFRHFQAMLGREGYDEGELTGFKAVLGFKLSNYVDFLVKQRRDDPVTFVMLLAHEFKFARDRAGDKATLIKWIERGAAIAELGRLVQIVSYRKHHRTTVGDVRAALRSLRGVPKSGARHKKARVATALPLIEQFAFGVESLRALFLGDRAGLPLAPKTEWKAATLTMRIAAVARCAWFAEDRPLPLPGFRTLASRFVRGRRGSAYCYYGIPLDMLLIVGIKDLATSLGRKGGIHSIRDLATEVHEGLFKGRETFHRSCYQAALYAEIYLRELGHGGSANRFDPRCWFETPRDNAQYVRLWRLFVGASNVESDKSARYQIRSAVSESWLELSSWLSSIMSCLRAGMASFMACGSSLETSFRSAFSANPFITSSPCCSGGYRHSP